MLKIYLSSVFIYMLIFIATVIVFKDGYLPKQDIYYKIKGRSPKEATIKEAIKSLILVCSIPILRIILIMYYIWISTTSDENFKKAIEKHKFL